MKRIKDYIVIILLICNSHAYAQTPHVQVAPTTLQTSNQPISLHPAVYSNKDAAQKKPLCYVAPDFYTKNFGFFCKQELKLEKCMRTPVHIRLGDIKYINWMEQKGANIYPEN